MAAHPRRTGGTRGEGRSRTPPMNGHGKSDRPIRPQTRSNDPCSLGKEIAEERGLTEGNSNQTGPPRTQSRKKGVGDGLERVREAATRDPDVRFTALLHHVTLARLESAYFSLKKNAATGVDGVTWEQYGRDLESNLRDLHGRLHRGSYRAKPARRASIPKSDGGIRLLGIASLEDKIAQRAVAEVLNAIYEADFLGFSYGFRPGRHPHRALDALAYCIIRRKVNWVLDADVRAYFDSIPHELLVSFVERRIGDRRVLRLLRKWLNAGVLEDDTLRTAREGTPQGATISPLLANLYLHYVFDVWAHAWRERHARGEVNIVRYADDFTVCFQFREDAERFQRALKERLTEYSLELHPVKTRLIEFGRFARRDRGRKGAGKPETFDFLGFTHICGVNRKGGFLLRRHTIGKRRRGKLKEIRQELRRRMHVSPKVVGQWLRCVLNGYFNYYAVPTNRHQLDRFRNEVARAWISMRQRRSDRDRTTWKRFQPVLDKWLPPTRPRHPFPDIRMQQRLT